MATQYYAVGGFTIDSGSSLTSVSVTPSGMNATVNNIDASSTTSASWCLPNSQDAAPKISLSGTDSDDNEYSNSLYAWYNEANDGTITFYCATSSNGTAQTIAQGDNLGNYKLLKSIFKLSGGNIVIGTFDGLTDDELQL